MENYYFLLPKKKNYFVLEVTFDYIHKPKLLKIVGNESKMEARKQLLENKDVINFNNVPDFIINSFFGKCDYKNRLLVSTFSYLNGISIEQMFDLIQWTDTKKTDKDKLRLLYSYYETDQYRQKYHSFNVHLGVVMYLNGDLRRFGCRVPKKICENGTRITLDNKKHTAALLLSKI